MYNTQSDPNVSYALWLLMMCQCSFIDCNKCTVLVGVLITGEAVHVLEISVPSSQFCCEPKTALKNKIY